MKRFKQVLSTVLVMTIALIALRTNIMSVNAADSYDILGRIIFNQVDYDTSIIEDESQINDLETPYFVYKSEIGELWDLRDEYERRKELFMPHLENLQTFYNENPIPELSDFVDSYDTENNLITAQAKYDEEVASREARLRPISEAFNTAQQYMDFEIYGPMCELGEVWRQTGTFYVTADYRTTPDVAQATPDVAQTTPVFFTPVEKEIISLKSSEPVEYVASIASEDGEKIPMRIENSIQGPKCLEIFKDEAKEDTLIRTYSFFANGSTDKNPIYSTEEQATIKVKIPTSALIENAEYYFICVSEGGQSYVFEDLDNQADTITINTNKYYAYALCMKMK